jgi:hypothetical protein
MSAPDPFTVNVPLAYVALPAIPTAPISRSSHVVGNGCEVTVKSMALLSFMLGATDTTSGPDVAPDGIVIVMEVLLQEFTVTGASFKRTTLLLCEAPKTDPEITT